MSANVDMMAYVGETPWHGLGIKLDVKPTTAAEIVAAANLGWTVDTTPMYTAKHNSVMNYHAVYRTDNNDILGVVNTAKPKVVQNTDTFKCLDELLKDRIDFDTVGDLGKGESVWGCFKLKETYKILDDDIDHYYVVFNDHVKVDGKVAILNTPVRVVCQNTLSAALSSAFYQIRVPVLSASNSPTEITTHIFNSAGDAIAQLTKRAEAMATTHVTKEYVETVMDTLFPYKTDLDPESITAARANEQISMIRTQFLTDCMGAENLNNYRGTQYQIFNALTDWSTHYFKNVGKAFDVNYRMKLLPGRSSDSPTTLVTKFLAMKDRIAA